MHQARFESPQNLSSDFVEWSCAVVIYNHYITILVCRYMSPIYFTYISENDASIVDSKQVNAGWEGFQKSK